MAKFSEGEIVTVKKPLEDYFRKIPSGANAKIVGVYGNGWYDIEVDGKVYGHSVSDAILAKNADTISLEEILRKNGISQQEFQKMLGEMQRKGARAVHFVRGKDGRLVYKADGTTIGNATLNAAYSKTLEYIMSSVRPYMDKRIKGDELWKYPMLVITVLRKVCDKSVMSAGRYDNGRPRHRIYDINCEKDGWKFSGNLIITGLLHRDDPDDVSTFDEYDMTLSLVNVGKATNSSNPVVANAIAWKAKNSKRRIVNLLATNAAGGNVKVTMQTVTFPLGKKPETRTMSLDKFEALLRSLGASDYSQRIMLALSTYGKAQFTLSDVDVDVAMP